ncbi:MAG: proteasome subunit beta [Nitrososphaerota archaeon]|nr:proteasome subunit beta [Candidatus Bathyarchaeota archaeon]MDW8062398.1 proteasome subunit beta [Nitrososphaerota archaeon]
MAFQYLPGATAVGIVARDGVILASEKRLSYGGYILSRRAKKIFRIAERIGFACAGLISDMQSLADLIKAEAKILELELGRPVTVRSAAKLTSNILVYHRMYPLLTEIIVGGYDRDEGYSLYVLDPLGVVLPDNYTALGSGAEVAIGVIESGYKRGIGLTDARELAVRSVKAASMRDATSGDGVDLLIISENDVKEEFIPIF